MAKSNSDKVTSARAARAASQVLRSGSTGKASKTAAGSALSQRPSRGKKSSQRHFSEKIGCSSILSFSFSEEDFPYLRFCEWDNLHKCMYFGNTE